MTDKWKHYGFTCTQTVGKRKRRYTELKYEENFEQIEPFYVETKGNQTIYNNAETTSNISKELHLHIANRNKRQTEVEGTLTRTATCADWVAGKAYWKWDFVIPAKCSSRSYIQSFITTFRNQVFQR